MSHTYALANPIAKILDKNPADFNRSDLLKIIDEKQIEKLTFHYTALDGKLKELKLPVSNIRQAERILAEGERVDGSSIFKGLVDTSLSDLYVVPVYRTAFLNPFDSASLDFICRYLTHEGKPASFAMDNILQQASDTFTQNTGFDLHAMGELEFFLIHKPKSNIYITSNQQGYHAAAPYVKSGEIVDEMVRQIAQITGSVKYAHSEVGYIESIRSDIDEIQGKQAEQIEIEFLPRPVVEAGDNLALARWLIRNIAYKYDCVATFAPKLEEGVAGNGMHIHMAVMKNGINIMAGVDGELSQTALQAIGGLCKYADSLTAFGNTTSSAYLRLVPNQEAPTNICWSERNRSAMIRVPLGWAKHSGLGKALNPHDADYVDKEGRQTIELRSPDGSAMVYLLLAGITMSADWGLNNPEALQLARDLKVKGNIFKNKELLKNLPKLPFSCVESSQVILEKRALYERDGIFPPSIIDYMAKLLLAEKDKNINRKLIDLPADDRLHATRKIMHKDLHRH